MPPDSSKPSSRCRGVKRTAIARKPAALSAPLPAVEPTVAITFKLPVSLVRVLRAYARRSGLTLGEIVTQALTAFLGAFHRRQRG